MIKDTHQFKKGEIVTVSEDHANEMAELKSAKILTKKKELIMNMGGEIIQITDKRQLIKKFLKHNPVFYNSSKMWWGWDKKELCWIKIDETDILRIINTKTGVNTISSKEKAELKLTSSTFALNVP